MSKSSTVTVRARPVEEVATASVGGLTIHGETLVISTDQRIELVDLQAERVDLLGGRDVGRGALGAALGVVGGGHGHGLLRLVPAVRRIRAGPLTERPRVRRTPGLHRGCAQTTTGTGVRYP